MNLFSTSPIGHHYGLGFLRIIVGVFMVYHGSEVFDHEKMDAYLQWDQFKNSLVATKVYTGKIIELVGGILLTAGFCTRLAALLIAVTMFYISFFVGTGKIWYEDQHPFMFVLLALVFFFIGPGKYSLDHYFRNNNMRALKQNR
jgi:putative oxidoreductase